MEMKQLQEQFRKTIKKKIFEQKKMSVCEV